MKKYIIYLILFGAIIFTNSNLYAQGYNVNIPQRDYWGNTHIHVLNQANQYLFWKKGFSYLDLCNNFDAIRVGDLDEDLFDPVYDYGGFTGYGVTVTHFWMGDYGDEQLNNFLEVYDNVPNAYMKVRKLIHGDYWAHMTDENNISHCFQYPDSPYGDPGLIDYFKHGHVYCTKKNPDGSVHGWETHSQYARTIITYKILGHAIHLLQDMTVPVHTQAIIHPDDDYEIFAGTYSLPYFNNTNTGEFHDPFSPSYGSDPIRGLFYTSNQIANLFPCNGESFLGFDYDIYGNNWFPNGMNNILSSYYQSIFPQNYSQIYNKRQQTDILVGYSINAVASFLYWFGETANLEKVYAPNITRFASNMIGDPIFGYDLYRNQTGSLTPVTTGTIYSYGWHAYECDNPQQIMFPFNMQNVYSQSSSTAQTLVLYNQSFLGNPCNSLNLGALPTAMYIQMRIGISNPWDFVLWTGRMTIRPQRYEMPSGCPFMFVLGSDTSGGKYFVENNLLHRSEFDEYSNQIISDVYKLSSAPRVDSNKITIQMIETSHDIDYFDQVKLIAVDHPSGSKIGVTESNDIVMYYPNDVSSTDNALKNNPMNNITGAVQYGQSQPKVTGVLNDYVYAHFDSVAQLKKGKSFKNRIKSSGKGSVDSLAIIGQLGSNSDINIPAPVKDWAGNLSIYSSSDTYIKNFAKRVLISDVIIPFARTDDNVDHIDINYNSDYAMNYFAVTPISYDGFTKTEMPLIEAVHGIEGNVLNKLTNIDNDFVVMDTTAIIDLKFNYIEQSDPGMIRDYVVIVAGKCLVGNQVTRNSRPNNSVNNFSNPQQISYKYKLNFNYPNPFNPTTKINFELEKPGFTKLSIYDVLGRLVDTPVNEYKQEGTYTIEYNGSHLSSGVYFYKIESNNFVDIKRMILIK